MPITIKRKISSTQTLGIWKINEKKDELFTLIQLSEDELRQYKKINNELRKLHWLACRVLLNELLNEKNLEIIYDEFGKPYLKDSSLKISISHAHEFAAIIIDENKETGIDIELINPKIERVIEKFMNDEELSSLN